MTISLAWLRKNGSLEELVIASDSRVRFGGHWDCAPKILQLRRGDAVLCFAGDTLYSYPIMLQAIAAMEQHPKIKSRAYDLEQLKGYFIDVLNNMISKVEDLPRGVDPTPETVFILAGWSWARNCFRAWQIFYNKKIKKYSFHSANPWAGGNKDKFLVFAGDYEDEFKSRLMRLLKNRNKHNRGGFDMEPFEILRDMIRNNTFNAIGGAPQLVKVYKHQNTLPFGILWPNDGSYQVNLLGRPLLEYEMTKYLIVNPDTLTTSKHNELPKSAEKITKRYFVSKVVDILHAIKCIKESDHHYK